jgi:hypothetical protein
VAVQPRRTLWRLAEVIEVVAETPRTKSLLLEVPGWEGHKAGQHVDVRLTAEDGYQAQRSYSIASAPEDERLMLTVDRLDDGEVSPYLTDVLMAGDNLEFRGPIGGYFTWEAADGGSLFLVGGGVWRGAADGHDPSPGCRRQRRAHPPALLLALLRGDHLPRVAGKTPSTRRFAGGEPHPDPLEAGGLERVRQAHRRRDA